MPQPLREPRQKHNIHNYAFGTIDKPLRFEEIASDVNTALSISAQKEYYGQTHNEFTMRSLGGSPLWRMMCEELLSKRKSPQELKKLFLVYSARLYAAGKEKFELPDPD